MAKKKSKRDKKRSKKGRAKEAEKAAKKLRRKTAKKAAKKTAKKAVKRPKATKKTAKKAAKKIVRRKAAKKAARPKAAKKATRPKAAKKATKPKRPIQQRPVAAAQPIAPAAPKSTPPIAPAAAPKPAQPTIIAAPPKPSAPSQQRPVTPSAPPKPQPAPQPQPEPAFLTGRFDPGIDRYYSMLAQNTPDSHRLGTLQVDRILAANPKDIVALAEKAHDIVNNWRNDVLSEETIKECQIEFSTGDPFACAHKWAQRSIDTAKAQGIASPYGHWARAYIYKYQKQPNQSSADYKTALGLPPKAFIGHVGRRRKDLIAEWLEALVYWAKREQLQKVIDKIDSDVPAGAGKLEAWINWVKCFALHLLGKFEASNALYPDYLPDDRDVNLIIAANHARLGREDLRQLHRKLFLEKAGNANWSAVKEIERSPFADKAMRDFWFESVDKALRAPAAPSAAPTPSI
jgi:hypothetical protein